MKIRSKINLSFLLAFSAIIIIAGFFLNFSFSKKIKSDTTAYLYSNNRARAEQIRTSLQARLIVSKTLAASIIFRDFLKESTNSENYGALLEKAGKRLKLTLDTDKNIFDIIILNRNGFVVAATDLSQIGSDQSKNIFFTEAIKNTYIKDTYVSEVLKKATFAVASPITDDDGSLLGVTVIRYDPGMFNDIASVESSLGNSEENYIINKEKIFITPSKFLGDSVILKQKVETANSASCFDATVDEYVSKNGYAGLVDKFGSQIIEDKDYRGIETVAAHSFIPETNWCLVTKVDRSDLYKYNYYLILSLVAIFFIAVIIFIILGSIITNKITSSILKLQDSMSKIEKGEVNVRLDNKDNDEIGELTRYFSKMVESVKNSHREIDLKVEQQTSEIKSKTVDLENRQKAMLNILEDIEKEKARALTLAAIIKDTEESIVGQDLEGKVTSWNRGAEKLYGYSEKEMIGQSILRIVPLDKHKELNDILEITKDGKKIDHFQTTRIKKGGDIVDVSISVAPIKDVDGNIIGMSAMTLDITKEKMIDRAKTEFVSLASHQLRTPLSTINWYAEMLLAGDAGVMNEEQTKFLKEIYAGNQRMVELVNALLNVSRIELGTFAVEPKPTKLEEVAKSVINEVMPQIKAKNLKMAEKYSTDLPEMMVDPKLMRIIFQNFITNSIKYTPPAGSINLAIDKRAKDVLISITDTGYGIPKSAQDKIFTKLYRADNVRDKETDGTGLGLYIVKSIIEQSGGKVWFESEENKGSTFFATIPLKGMVKKEGNKDLT